jgi:hypothetical protein
MEKFDFVHEVRSAIYMRRASQPEHAAVLKTLLEPKHLAQYLNKLKGVMIAIDRMVTVEKPPRFEAALRILDLVWPSTVTTDGIMWSAFDVTAQAFWKEPPSAKAFERSMLRIALDSALKYQRCSPNYDQVRLIEREVAALPKLEQDVLRLLAGHRKLKNIARLKRMRSSQIAQARDKALVRLQRKLTAFGLLRYMQTAVQFHVDDVERKRKTLRAMEELAKSGKSGLEYDDVLPGLLVPLEMFDLSTRTLRCLNADMTFFLGQLAHQSEDEVLRTDGFWKVSVKELKDLLAKYGLHFGMYQPEALWKAVCKACNHEIYDARRIECNRVL